MSFVLNRNVKEAKVINYYIEKFRLDFDVSILLCYEKNELDTKIMLEEKSYLRYRRSIVVKKDIKEGEIFTAENLTIVRPDIGITPSKLENVLGKTASRNLEFGEGLKLSDINES